MSHRGIFISFEGSEGCGKTTQIRLLADALREEGHPVVLTREPGGTPVGEQIRHTLQHAAESSEMTPAAELLLFAASRAQLVREVIVPALDRGAAVISDRFLDSTTVYQGLARRIPAGAVRMINEFAIDGHLPDLTFVLDLPAEQSRARILSRPPHDGGLDRIESEPLEFYERVRAGYLEVASREPHRFRVLDAGASRASIAAQILEHVQESLNGLSTTRSI